SPCTSPDLHQLHLSPTRRSSDLALRNIRQGISCRDESVMRDLLYNEIVVYERQLDFETAQSKMREFLERYPGDEEALRENQRMIDRKSTRLNSSHVSNSYAALSV